MSDKANKTYRSGNVDVVWTPSLCTHSGVCVRGLPGVFNTKKRPWINVEGADTQRIVNQVKQCPSGALSLANAHVEVDSAPIVTVPKASVRVQVSVAGPLIIREPITVVHADGREEKREKTTAFCRCGASSNKPFCDGSHRKVGFTGDNQ